MLSNEHETRSPVKSNSRAPRKSFSTTTFARRVERAGLPPTAQVAVEATAAATTAEERQRDADREVRSLTADVEHLTASLRDLEDVDAPTLAVAEKFRGRSRSQRPSPARPAWSEPSRRPWRRRTADSPSPPGSIDWSLLAALKRAGVTLARLIVAHGQQPRLQLFPGATPLLAEVQTDGRREVEEALADVVLVDDLRLCPHDFPGLAVAHERRVYRPRSGQLGLAAGVPAALLFERRATLARLRTELEQAVGRAANVSKC